MMGLDECCRKKCPMHEINSSLNEALLGMDL